MSSDALRELLNEHWSALATEQTSGERTLRVSELPTDTVNGKLAVAVDHDSNRHILIPIRSNQRVRDGLAGPVLSLRKRPLESPDSFQHFADLGCLRRDMDDLFTLLCADVAEATAAHSDNPLKALYTVLNRWKALFQTENVPLGPEQLAGLFGELSVLRRLLEIDSSAHRLWSGPTGSHHDFAGGLSAIEVKSTHRAEARRPRIHGLRQLEPPEAGKLWLVCYRLERGTEKGKGMLELVGEVLDLCDDEATLLGLLGEAGFRAGDAEHYSDARFRVAEEYWYEVDETFPGLTHRRLTLAGITVSAHDVEYTVDLSGSRVLPLDGAAVTEVLLTVLGQLP